jgi:hypothetical protein
VNWSAVLDANRKGRVIELEAIPVPILRQGVTVAFIVASVELQNTSAIVCIRIEIGTHVAPLAANIEKHAPVTVVEVAGAVRVDGELVESHLEGAHGKRIVRGCWYIVPAQENALGEKSGGGTREGKNDA